VPTHQHYNSHNNDRQLYARVGDALYSVNSGHCYDFDEYDQKLNLQALTPEQACGYASGGETVPDTTVMKNPEEHSHFTAKMAWGRMIYPFEPDQVRMLEIEIPHERDGTSRTEYKKIISYGTSSMGYDVRLAEEFRIFSNVNSAIIDPKKFDERCLVAGELRIDEDGSKYVLLPPNSYLLGHTIEYMRIPRDIMVIAIGKSTYARAGAIVNVTPIEPGFEGTVVIEVSNSTPLPLKVYANEGIAQFVFFRGEACETSYGDRGGKYQGQQGIVLPKT
jgi:dCTP deaminase